MNLEGSVLKRCYLHTSPYPYVADGSWAQELGKQLWKYCWGEGVNILYDLFLFWFFDIFLGLNNFFLIIVKVYYNFSTQLI